MVCKGEKLGHGVGVHGMGVSKMPLTTLRLTSTGIAYPARLLKPKLVGAGDDNFFRYQKVFGEDLFMAAGVVELPIGGKKPGKASKDNAYVSLDTSVTMDCRSARKDKLTG